MATQVMTGLEGMNAGRSHGDGVQDRIRERNQALLAAQQRARRGPTPEAFFAKKIDNSRLRKSPDPRRSKEMRTFSVVMGLFLCLLLVYGWQHFSSIEYGYSIATQKQELRKLRESNFHLRLTEAQLNSPGRIDRLANQLGLSTPEPGQVVRPDGSTISNAPVLAESTPPPMR
jgi:hypothetical protein